MTAETIFATGRVVERLIICAIAGLCLTYGWNLFRVGVLNEQSAELSGNGWKFNLKRVGPGVFFALFGSIVLAFSLRSPLSIPATAGRQDGGKSDTKESVPSTDNKPPLIVYAESQNTEIAKRWVADLNTVLNLETPDKFSDSTRRKIIGRTNDDLETLRNTLVIQQFGAAMFRDYQAYRKKQADGDAPSPAEHQKFVQIEEWMQGTRIME